MNGRGHKKKLTEDDSCLRGVEGQLKAAAQRGYPNPEDAEDPVTAAPKQRPMLTTNRSFLALSHRHDHS